MSLTPIYDDLMREFEDIVGVAPAVEGDAAPTPDEQPAEAQG
ncbi:hypothetical protein [Saccharothrix coeruleofusca]|uniref:Uncharacterized protein n=1 Tax=Saccharothrix coeruleofusca TaxID=33919 RepID=A0A918ARJ7_9PSEU|nr:hypothetical protein [Saccharothrix coeruleofusca]MBP2334653.1 hypothetical protein [Saccharothrix coeruleofusca]GGP72979.1 hypothetical protein GCM10010185_52970 [Saccharothrix coeruleofusca]